MLTLFCRRACTRFIADEAGAISVEYVAITAACVAIAYAALNVFAGGVEDLVSEMSAHFVELNPTDSFLTPDGDDRSPQLE